MPRLKSERLAEKAKLEAAHKANPKAKAEATARGVVYGAQVRYVEELVERFGTVRAVGSNFVVVEQTAVVYTKDGRMRELYPGGKNVIVRSDKIPFSQVKEVVGIGLLAKPVPEVKVVRMAPMRDEGYRNCDFCENKIAVVQKTSKGIFALCKDHNENPHETAGGEYQAIVFKFGLGILGETYNVWPTETEAN